LTFVQLFAKILSDGYEVEYRERMMEDYVNLEKRRVSLVYPLGGFFAGLLFVIAAYAIEILLLSYSPLQNTLWHTFHLLHAVNPILYITDLAPFILMIAGVLAGRKHEESIRYLVKLQDLLKERSTRLKTISQRYGNLFARIDDCLFETDMAGMIRDMNPAGLKILKIPEFLGTESEDKEVILEEMRRRKISAVDLYENPEDRKRLINDLLKEGKITNLQVRIKRLNGVAFDAVLDAFIDYDEKGQPIILGKLVDLSAIKQAQYLLQETNQLLSEKNSELSETVAELQMLKERYQQRSSELDSLNSELKKTNMKLEEMAITDGLTGLFNHRHLMKLLIREWERSKRNRKEFCLLMIDIDHFKEFNDTWGHQTGDRVLRLVAEKIRLRIRPYDIAARYGGEEFVIILPETNTTTAHAVASRIRKTVEETDLMLEKDKKKGKVTVSIGLTAFMPDKGDPRSSDQLLQDADSGLYLAKNRGRNRIETYHRDFLAEDTKLLRVPEKN